MLFMPSSFIICIAYFAIISAAISWPGVQAHSGNHLRRRNINEQQQQQQVTCPCVDAVLDDKLINAANNLEIDLHRARSCASDKPNNMERIYWTPINPSDRPNTNIVRSIDGVKYNYLKAIHDPTNSYYSCTRNDVRMDDITPEQAHACIDVLQHTCDDIKPQLCEFDVTLMESVKSSVSDGHLILDQDMSCKDPRSNSKESYGIYTKEASSSTATAGIKVAISYNKDAIMVDSESQQEMSNEMQGTHCTNLIAATCYEWTLTKREDSKCVDDPDFTLHGNIVEEEFEAMKVFFSGTGTATSNVEKNCEWVAEDLSQCRAKSKSGQRVFEACRQTCGYCTCSDMEDFRFNGQEDKGCEWIKKDSSSRCSLEGASEYCKASCGTKCCRDNTSFRFQKEEHKTCEWARKNTAQRCAKRAVAANCPETCGLCPSS